MSGRLLRALLIAAIVTSLAWAALYLPPKTKGWLWLAFPGGIVLLPGGLVAAVVALVFSPEGIHGIEDFSWLIVLGSWLVYFWFFFMWFRREAN